jgi:hypothetical protein
MIRHSGDDLTLDFAESMCTSCKVSLIIDFDGFAVKRPRMLAGGRIEDNLLVESVRDSSDTSGLAEGYIGLVVSVFGWREVMGFIQGVAIGACLTVKISDASIPLTPIQVRNGRWYRQGIPD